jgi:hypothetical protein
MNRSTNQSRGDLNAEKSANVVSFSAAASSRVFRSGTHHHVTVMTISGIDTHTSAATLTALGGSYQWIK